MAPFAINGKTITTDSQETSLSYDLATPALAAGARNVDIYKGEKFSDHAPITIEYDFKP